VFPLIPIVLAVISLIVRDDQPVEFVPDAPTAPAVVRAVGPVSTPVLAPLPPPVIVSDSSLAHAAAATPLPTSEEIKVARYVELASERLDDRMEHALDRIEGTDRKLLALKYYQRRKGNVSAQWAWDEQKIAAHLRSKEHRLAVREIATIKKVFAEQNPGYELKVNTDVRSLETQIEIWNEFSSVERAGDDLMTVARKVMKDSARWPVDPSPRDLSRFTTLLQSTGVSVLPTAAVPGFSLHGRGRAFDFIIRKDDQIVAGAVSATARRVWDKPGWTEKLSKAITTVSKRFRGPLRAPYEPWHYEFRP
jgi:hypothetical protein